ncbi:MAG TPA: hypothetical protein VF644_06815 [Pyrinomonadaceae bacterium]|jgi:hypothetical protein
MSGMDIQAIIKQAEEVAMTVDKSLREAAFNRTVELLTRQQGHVAGSTTTKSTAATPAKAKFSEDKAQVDEIAALMQIDRTSHPEILKAQSVLDRSLHLLRIANNECQVDGLKAPQIAKILTDKFRLRTTRQAVGQALDKAGDKVDRIPSDNGIVYRIMSRGESYLDDEGSRDSDQHHSAVSRKSNGKQTQETNGREAKRGKTKEVGAKKRSGRPGPKAMLTQLIAEGFFKIPKVISDIQTQLENAQGYRYKSTELAPALVRLLRDNVISREKNSEGQYEYKSK